MKLTRTQQGAIRRALADAEAVRDYIMRPDHAVCLRRKDASTTLDYTRADGAVLYEVAREYGSDLCRIHAAIRELQGLLVQQSGSCDPVALVKGAESC